MSASEKLDNEKKEREINWANTCKTISEQYNTNNVNIKYVLLLTDGDLDMLKTAARISNMELSLFIKIAALKKARKEIKKLVKEIEAKK